MQLRHILTTLAVGIAALGTVDKANAAVIISPTSGVINSGGPGFGSLSDTFDQSGLSDNFISGVTDFDEYLSLNPIHTLVFFGFEWFSNEGTSSASVTYDLGNSYNIDRLALWNEESSGIGNLDLYYSQDGINFSALSVGLNPFDNPLADYSAEVFSFETTKARYVRFDMSDCPQQNPGGFSSCAIGEVAFSSAVPEPTTILGTLAFSALGGSTWLKRRRKQQA